MTIQVEIPDDLYARTEAESSRRGMSQDDLVVEALKSLLGDASVHGGITDAEITASYQKVLAENPDAFKLDPALEEQARQLLLQSEW